MISVSEVINSPEFAQNFTIYRSTGSFVDGVWTEDTPRQITVRGVVTVMNARALNQMTGGEGDRIKGGMTFHTTVQVYTTRTGTTPGTSDKIKWRGEFYKIFQVNPEVDYGYWKSSGERIAGD